MQVWVTNLRMDQGKGRDTLRPMATIKKGSGLGKDKKPTCPSVTPGPAQGLRRHSLGSTLPNKSTKCPTTDASTATKNVKKTSQPQKPDPLRRSIAQKKPLVSQKPTTTTRSVSFPSKPKPTLDRVAKTPIAPKPTTLSSSSRTKTKSMKAAPSINRGTTTSSASKKPPQAKKLENKENLGHQVEEVVKDVQGEIHDIQMPKAEEETQQHAQVEEKYILDDVFVVTHEQQHQEPRTEEMEDKFDEDGSNSDDQHEEAKENDSEEEINVSHDEQEKTTHEETKIETKDKGVEEGNTTEEVAITEENNDDGKEQGIESVEEEANVVAQSQAEATDGEIEMVEEEANLVFKSQVDEDKKTVEEEANLVPESQVEEDANTVLESQVEAETKAAAHEKEIPESQVQGEEGEKVEEKPNSVVESRVQAKAANGKNEPPTPNSDVVEVTTSKPVIERKGRVRALVGAFESKW
ncbi:hypothetical protein HRI_002620700 [Hibiscus trionum]|uniref:Uncharacterized protein n=1 Tax=Hibiscus trionum TaxID=183268 RepID=A0A9W7I526_HIBTR|nr:hypothetical protein HRI_002620700 [Hibiscus trionum]